MAPNVSAWRGRREGEKQSFDVLLCVGLGCALYFIFLRFFLKKKCGIKI